MNASRRRFRSRDAGLLGDEADGLSDDEVENIADMPKRWLTW